MVRSSSLKKKKKLLTGPLISAQAFPATLSYARFVDIHQFNLPFMY